MARTRSSAPFGRDAQPVQLGHHFIVAPVEPAAAFGIGRERPCRDRRQEHGDCQGHQLARRQSGRVEERAASDQVNAPYDEPEDRGRGAGDHGPKPADLGSQINRRLGFCGRCRVGVRRIGRCGDLTRFGRCGIVRNSNGCHVAARTRRQIIGHGRAPRGTQVRFRTHCCPANC